MTYYYYINLLKETEWKGTRIGNYETLKDYSYNELRGLPQINIPNGGWHFSFMGGPDKVRLKIESYSAQDMGTKHVMNSIPDNITRGIDPFFRSKLTEVKIDGTYPRYLLEHLDEYKHMIK
jgi:beta-1,4-mannosyl-glycoprotein beta-1,4-N-acetylglucosaminyltransferase